MRLSHPAEVCIKSWHVSCLPINMHAVGQMADGRCLNASMPYSMLHNWASKRKYATYAIAWLLTTNSHFCIGTIKKLRHIKSVHLTSGWTCTAAVITMILGLRGKNRYNYSALFLPLLFFKHPLIIQLKQACVYHSLHYWRLYIHLSVWKDE